MSWLKARLNEPSTHVALAILLKMAGSLLPADDQIYVDAAAALLAAFGFALPESVKAKVEQAAK